MNLFVKSIRYESSGDDFNIIAYESEKSLEHYIVFTFGYKQLVNVKSKPLWFRVSNGNKIMIRLCILFNGSHTQTHT